MTDDYPIEVKEAWTEIIIKCYKDPSFLESLRADPAAAVKSKGRIVIRGSKGQYFPLPGPDTPDNFPDELKGLDQNLIEEKLKDPEQRCFGEMMMMGGAWASKGGDLWIEIIVQAWIDPNFLAALRQNPKEAISEKFPEKIEKINESQGKYFPIVSSEDLPSVLRDSVPGPREPRSTIQDKEKVLREKLNTDNPDTDYMGWMMTCCR